MQIPNMTLQLTLTEVTQNARSAYDNKRLQAQNVDRELPRTHIRCLYSGPCAIGVSIPFETAMEWDDHDMTVCSLLDTKRISIHHNGKSISNKGVNYWAVVNLQNHHDNWVRETDIESLAQCETNFVKALNALERLIK